MAAVARRPERNPVEKRAEWIAKHYPRTVVADTLAAWAEAVGADAYVARFRQAASYETVETALKLLDMVIAQRPDLRTTIYDAYLPWVAKTLNEKHKLILRFYRRLAATYPGDEHLQEIAKGRDYGEVLSARRSVYSPQHALGIEAMDDFTLLRDQMIPQFGFIGYWADRARMDLGPLSFEEASDAARAWMAVEQSSAAPSADPHGVLIYAWPDGWVIRELKTKADLVDEGIRMGHCTKNYKSFDGRRLFSLRDPKNVPHATLEWFPQHGYVNQLRGRGNVLPMSKHTARMAEFRDQYFPTMTMMKVPVSATDEVRGGSKFFDGRYVITRGTKGSETFIEVWNGTFYDPEDVDESIGDFLARLQERKLTTAQRAKQISTYFPHGDVSVGLPPVNEWFFARRGPGHALLDNDDELVQAVRLAVDKAEGRPIFTAIREPTGKRV